jgi:hypothetical protein
MTTATQDKEKKYNWNLDDYFEELYGNNKYHMPAMDLSDVKPDIKPDVYEGVEEVRREDPVGIEEERYNGRIPITIDNDDGYKGVTEIKGDYRGRTRAERIGISNRVSKREAKRVAKHEGRHVRSEVLAGYGEDVSPWMRTLVMESYAEFGGMIAAIKAGKPEEAAEIQATTPYPQAVQFGKHVDKHYVSDIDGNRGYETFIRDIQRNKSMAKTLDNLSRNLRASMDSGYRR